MYQNDLPCSTGDWSLLYLCNVRLPLNRDDHENFEWGTVGHECRVRACHIGGVQLLSEVFSSEVAQGFDLFKVNTWT